MKWAVAITVAVLVALTFNIALPLLTKSDDRGVRSESLMERAFDARSVPVSDIECEDRTCTAIDGAGRPITCTVVPGQRPERAVSCAPDRR